MDPGGKGASTRSAVGCSTVCMQSSSSHSRIHARNVDMTGI